MSDKVFLDTNILVYCYTETEPNKKAAAQLLAQGDDVWISTQVLQEFSNTLRKKFHREWSDVQAAITEICLNFEVYVNRPETVQDAISIAGRYGYTLYDSLILSSCLAIECKTLYSEDMQHKQIIDDSLIIVNPFQS